MNSTFLWWYKMPMLRIIISLITGILAYSYKENYSIWIVLIIPLSIIYILNSPVKIKILIRGSILSILLFLTGYISCVIQDIRNQKNWIGKYQASNFIIKINNHPVKGDYYQSMFADVKYMRSDTTWIKVIGRIRLQIPLTSKITKESILLISKPLINIPDTGSRKSYSRYLANQDIYHQVKLKAHELKILEQPEIKENNIEFLQRNTLKIIDYYFQFQTIRGLAKALLVGYRGELDKELNTAYTNTGVVHVIAISGLHLGLIYGLLMLLFKPFQRHSTGRILSCLIILIILWVFTMMCGATPSVVRSAIMFSFLLLGNIIQSKPSTGNILAVSAFLMLVINPFLIYDIGFQLSYAAVGSLLIYNTSISSIYQPENGFLKMGWSSIATSLSAQILTTPFVLFHFHQFPIIFILSNIIAIPLSSIALLLLILICLFARLPVVAHPIAFLTEKTIWLMNDRIVELAALPFSRLDNLPFNSQDLALSLICIGCMTIYLKQKHPLALKAFFSTVLIWSILYHYSS